MPQQQGERNGPPPQNRRGNKHVSVHRFLIRHGSPLCRNNELHPIIDKLYQLIFSPGSLYGYSMKLCIPMTACLLAACSGPALAGSEAEPIRVFAHYMPWFKAEQQADGSMRWEHWQWFGKGPKHDPDDIRDDGRRDIGSVFYPLIGPYDSRNPSVLEYHFLSAKAVGIEGFIADWYGPGTYTDEVFARMTDTAEELGMSVAVCLEEKAFFPPYSDATSRVEVVDEAVRHLQHVLDVHASRPGYLTLDGKPVFYMFNNHQDGILGRHVLTPDEFARIRERINRPFVFMRGYIDPDMADHIDGVYAWCGSDEDRTWFHREAAKLKDAGRIRWISGVACPGFDDSGVWGWGNGPRIVDRRDGAEYRDNWNTVDAWRSSIDIVQVVTWNDFQEGTTIEPAVEYGFTYLDQTERAVAELNGKTAHTEDNRYPHRLYHLRAKAAALTGEEAERWNRTLDELASTMAGGKHWMTSLRLWYYEKRLARR